MLTGPRRLVAPSVFLALTLPGLTSAGKADEPRLPRVAAGWSIALAQQAPAIQYPTAIVVAPDGTIYLGQDPMNMPGPVNLADRLGHDAIRPDGSTRTSSPKSSRASWGWSGWMERWYVVHAPYLSSLRDTDGDGVADQRVDLVTGLGPAGSGVRTA